MGLKTVFYGRNFAYKKDLDGALKCFDAGDYLSFQLLFKNEQPKEFDATFKQLERDGMITMERNGFRITLAGKMRISSGGYMRDALIKRIIFFSTIIGIVGSIIGIVLIFL
jgi:hypothetical protein